MAPRGATRVTPASIAPTRLGTAHTTPVPTRTAHESTPERSGLRRRALCAPERPARARAHELDAAVGVAAHVYPGVLLARVAHALPPSCHRGIAVLPCSYSSVSPAMKQFPDSPHAPAETHGWPPISVVMPVLERGAAPARGRRRRSSPRTTRASSRSSSRSGPSRDRTDEIAAGARGRGPAGAPWSPTRPGAPRRAERRDRRRAATTIVVRVDGHAMLPARLRAHRRRDAARRPAPTTSAGSWRPRASRRSSRRSPAR